MQDVVVEEEEEDNYMTRHSANLADQGLRYMWRLSSDEY